MSCLANIRALRDDMSANEKRLADFILDNAPLIRDYSSQQIAGSVGVSQSSVVKFSQKIGYKGFTDLKLAIHESVIKQGTNVALLRSTDSGSRLEASPRDELLNGKTDAMMRAGELNKQRVIDAAAGAIRSADRVQVIGVGAASIVARDLAFKLMALGKPVIADADMQLQLSGATTLSRGDCLFVFSERGQEPALIQIVKQAKKAGVAIVALTNEGGNPVSALADLRLFTAAAASDGGLSVIAVAASQQHVIDMLYQSFVLSRGQAESGKDRASDVS